MATTTSSKAAALVERVLTALYAREPHVKAVVAVTGGGTGAAELLFRAGSSSTMLQYSVPYSRASLHSFLQPSTNASSDARAKTPTLAPEIKSCSREMAERMAVAAWEQAQRLLWEEACRDDASTASATQEREGEAGLPATLQRFRSAVGVACTAALATSYDRRGANQGFISICRVDDGAAVLADDATVAPSPRVLQRHCETFHVHLDKAMRRSRQEEDRIMSQYIVYALAKSAGVDPEGCDALLDTLAAHHNGQEDRFDVLPRERKDELGTKHVNPLSLFGQGGAETMPMSVMFVPVLPGIGKPLVARDVPFRGLVLPGSFNPLHSGHVDLALAAQRLYQRERGETLPIAFELAVANADKGSLDSEAVLRRVHQFAGDTTAPDDPSRQLGAWPVLVTNATLFGQKAALLRDCVFVIGADTAVRLVDKKYYDMDEHKMVLVLDQIARDGCSFIMTGRFDRDVEKRYIPAEEVLERHIPRVFQRMFMPLREEDYRYDMSSTMIRKQQEASIPGL